MAAAIVTSAITSGQVRGEIPIVHVAVSPRTAAIGDRLILEVSLTGSPDIVSARPAIDAIIGDFEVGEVVVQAPTRNRKQWTQSWRFTVVTFEHGKRDIPPVSVEGRLSNGARFTVTSREPLSVAIDEPTVSWEDPMRPVTSVMAVPGGVEWLAAFPWWVAAVAFGIVLTALAAVALWPSLLRWRRRHAFWRRLIADAQTLRAAADAHAVRDQYMAASALLRRGVARSIDQAVDSYTTAEMVVCVATLGQDGSRICPPLWTIMSHLDEVRFGGPPPDPYIKHRALDEVVAMLRTLRAVTRSSGR